MQNFHISAPPVGGSLRVTRVGVDTSIGAAGTAQAKVTTEKSVTNPLYILSTGMIGKQDLHSSSKSFTVDGAGNAGLDTAVKALHALGEQHGVVGINLNADASFVGGVMLKGSGAFVTNTAEAKAIGAENLRSLDDAARTVLGLALTGN